jgi:hypothetical protein
VQEEGDRDEVTEDAVAEGEIDTPEEFETAMGEAEESKE